MAYNYGTVTELNAVQFFSEIKLWLQNWTRAEHKLDLKSQVWFQTKIAQHDVQLLINYNNPY